VDVLVIPSIQALRIAKKVTTSIPIVMVTPTDPVQAGLITSLAKPAGKSPELRDSPEVSVENAWKF
jgi:ABC-type uncharacterized transport system substrate-binding protein